MRILTTILRFVQYSSMKYKIDESHALGHSMNVLYYAQQIYNQEVVKNPILRTQEQVIYSAAMIHDLYDRKYPAPTIPSIKTVLQFKLKTQDIDAVEQIVNKMSYSKVKTNGFPDLGKYQTAYHIVREADLLTSYDFDRAMIYNMYHTTGDVFETFKESREFFENRVLKYENQDIFTTDYAKTNAHNLRIKSIEQIKSWNSVIQSFERYI
jgi:HD superfamily phosphodiesterase